MDILLSESENIYDALIEKQTESKDQLINQDSGNAVFEKKKKVFNYDEISDIQSYPYLKFDNEKGMFQCSIFDYLSLKRSDSLKHIKRKHKKEIRSKEEGLNDIIAAENDDCDQITNDLKTSTESNPESPKKLNLAKLFPYLKFDHIENKFQCTICNKTTYADTSHGRRGLLRHIKLMHKYDLESNMDFLPNIRSENCVNSICRKKYGSYKKFWCENCLTILKVKKSKKKIQNWTQWNKSSFEEKIMPRLW